MMSSFLRQVADHYYALGPGELEKMCFIFPNRRSMAFWRKSLADAVAEDPLSQPIVVPRLYTINDFFYSLSGTGPSSRVSLLLELYACYSALRAERGLSVEPLDDFIFWGDVILADFGEIDKYRVDAHSLYRNVSDLHALQDDFSDLSEEQVAAIRRFISHFRNSSAPGADIHSAPVKAGFLQVWELMSPLYERFRETLRHKGMAYEGMVYRDLADRVVEGGVRDLLDRHFPAGTTFVFVGLNALNECEKLLMRRMRSAGIAQWCWDYASDMVKHPQNASSLFMERNVADFPPAFDAGCGTTPPEINVLSVPSATGQAKQLPMIFDRLGGVQGLETAVVLPDENLLVPVLNSIPEGITDINVTMGYPMSGSAFHALVGQISALQMHLRLKDGKWYFYHRQVWAILGSSILSAVLDEGEKFRAEDIRKAGRYYIEQADFEGMPLLERIFTPVIKDPSAAGPDQTSALAEYLLSVISALGAKMTSNPSLALELEFARSYYEALTSLSEHTLPVRAQTWIRLLSRMVSAESVHFRGEPLRGLQIMGPLETRALDFDNLIILSCNEGVFPRHPVGASFIPHELRKAFGLPTYEYQDAIWAYYFYRLIQRARHVWLVYDSRLEGVRSGEESRYIKQLEMHFGVRTNRFVAKAPLLPAEETAAIPKTGEHVRIIRSGSLSASTLQAYLECPARFYYHSVEHLHDRDELADSMDAGAVGDVFHEAMKQLYTVPGGILTADYLKGLPAQKESRIRPMVKGIICDKMGTFDVSGRDLIYEDVIIEYILKVISRDLELMDRRGVDSIKIVRLEVKEPFEVDGLKFTGTLDRLDSVVPGELRVVDYKSGRVLPSEFNINDDNAAEIVRKLFDPQTKSADRPKIALQLYLYDVLVSEKYPGMRIVNSIYQPSRLYSSEVCESPLSAQFAALMKEGLSSLLHELLSTEVPFYLASDRDRCVYCDFKMICGR